MYANFYCLFILSLLMHFLISILSIIYIYIYNREKTRRTTNAENNLHDKKFGSWILKTFFRKLLSLYHFYFWIYMSEILFYAIKFYLCPLFFFWASTVNFVNRYKLSHKEKNQRRPISLTDLSLYAKFYT